MNISCVICSDLLTQAENIYFTKCGHVFHYSCLMQWLERSKSCPQCRQSLSEKSIKRVYFNFASGEGITDDVTTLQSKLDNANFQVGTRDKDLEEMRAKLNTLKLKVKKNEELLKSSEENVLSKTCIITTLKEQLMYLKVQNNETEKLREENDRLNKAMNTLTGLQKVLNSTSSEVEEMMQSASDVRTVATFATALKKALIDAESKKEQARNSLRNVQHDLNKERNNNTELHKKITKLEDELIQREMVCSGLKEKLRKMKRRRTDLDESMEGTPNKVNRREDSSVIRSFIESAQNCFGSPENLSIGTLVKKIEDADSPYLRLKQSSAALAPLRLRLPTHGKNPMVKPSTFGTVKSSSSKVIPTTNFKPVHNIDNSLFSKDAFLDRNLGILNQMKKEGRKHDTSYDGLGGHSKPDVFPVPQNKISPKKNFSVKLSSKHRLKRPDSQAVNSITKYMKTD